MKHIFFIDQLEKLNCKKDSSLMMAHSFCEKGEEVYLLFEEDFAITNTKEQSLKLYDFSARFVDNSFYLEHFSLRASQVYQINSGDIVHFRIDPPVDSRYLRFLWMLDFLESKGVKTYNRPQGILKYNEKLLAYSLEGSYPSYVGRSISLFQEFVQRMKALGHDSLIFKPLDLFSGIGVDKHSIEHPNLTEAFESTVKALGGAVVVQPFISQVYQGEHRSVFFKGEHLGTILKTPVKGEFLTNIAQGAQFQRDQISDDLMKKCQNLNTQLSQDGIDWVAYDILDGVITEVNITCPGLLVEVSTAMEKNLAHDLHRLIT